MSTDHKFRFGVQVGGSHSAADWRDLGHTFHRFQRVPDVPILERAQRRQIMFAALVDQRVLVNPTNASGVRSNDRIDTFRQRSANRV